MMGLESGVLLVVTLAACSHDICCKAGRHGAQSL